MSPKRASSNHVVTPVQIGARLRLRRLELELSLEQVATRVGVKYQQVQKYERGLHQMNMTMAQKMARALSVSLVYFVTKPNGS